MKRESFLPYPQKGTEKTAVAGSITKEGFQPRPQYVLMQRGRGRGRDRGGERDRSKGKNDGWRKQRKREEE